MNLEDYAYEDDGRWYIRPEVALNEQNAFINNYRNIEAQNNAQIAQQTRALGTQVPSQLGGLVGGGGYFRSRYQTPQTNQVVADLRSQMQGQALQTVLQNELEKAKKKYKDAQNSALKPSNANNTNPWSVDDRGTDDSKKRDTEYVGDIVVSNDDSEYSQKPGETDEEYRKRLEEAGKVLDTETGNIRDNNLWSFFIDKWANQSPLERGWGF